VEAAFAYAVAALDTVAPGRAPVEIDDFPGELDLRPSPSVAFPADTAGPPDSGGGSGVPAPPRPVTPPTTRPPVTTTRYCLLGLICSG
jgi:hypothetical protein